MTHVIRSSRITCACKGPDRISAAPGTRRYQYGSRRTLFVNGVLSEVRVVVFDAGAKPSCERARRRRCTSASERRFGSSLAHTAERLAGLETASPPSVCAGAF